MKLTRITNKDNQPTSIVKATFTNIEDYNEALKYGIRLGYTRYKGETEMKLLQCYNCQKVGHSAFGCMAQTKCLKCAGHHKSNVCKASSLKCANCGGNHAACSRQCPYLIESEKKRVEKARSTPTQVIPSHAARPTSYKAALSNQLSDELKEVIVALIKSTIEQQLGSWLGSIKDSFKETIGSHIKKTLSLNPQNQVNQAQAKLQTSVSPFHHSIHNHTQNATTSSKPNQQNKGKQQSNQNHV